MSKDKPRKVKLHLTAEAPNYDAAHNLVQRFIDFALQLDATICSQAHMGPKSAGVSITVRDWTFHIDEAK